MAEPVGQPSRKRRLDAERSRTAVLEAAVAVLGRHADASIEDIAAAAGVVRQTVYAHFPSRAALVDAVVEFLTARTVQALAQLDLEAGPADEALLRWLEASWAIVERYPALLSPAITTTSRDDHAQHQPVTAELVALVHRGHQSGVFDARLSETWIVAAVIALGHAAGQQVIAGRMSPPEAGAAFRDSVLRLVRA